MRTGQDKNGKWTETVTTRFLSFVEITTPVNRKVCVSVPEIVSIEDAHKTPYDCPRIYLSDVRCYAFMEPSYEELKEIIAKGSDNAY